MERFAHTRASTCPIRGFPCRPLLTKIVPDLAWAVEQDIDYIALSFVRSPKDLEELRYELRRYTSDLQVISKIERPEAVECLDEIINLSDAVLVARGDLGVEMDLSKVPLIQKKIVHLCARSGKPVIVATQMLQTMSNRPCPRGPKSVTWPTPFLTAPMRLCSRPRRPLAAIPLKRSA